MVYCENLDWDMDTKNIKLVVFFLMLMIALQQQVFAQAPKLVMGRVLNKEESEKAHKPIPFNLDQIGDIKIYYFNTEQEGKDMMEALNQNNINMTLSAMYEVPDASGAYQITLPETGSIVIKVSSAPPVLEEIKGRREITTYVDLGHVLQQVNVFGGRKEPTPTPPDDEQYGDMLFLSGLGMAIDESSAKPNARMIIQPYVINNNKNQEVVMYRLPHVFDGDEYGVTQHRRMGYDLQNDSLGAFIDEKSPLKKNGKYIWNDTIKLPNANENFQLVARAQLVDYTRPYWDKYVELSPKARRRPLQFLEYSLEQYELDPKKYEEKPKVERRTGVEDVSLSFLLGKAELDPEDPNNEIQLDKLKAKLLEVVNGESSTLKELHLYSVSSPEGSYASNMALSQRRLAFARSLIYSVIPQHTMKRLYTYTPNDSRVATWLEVADLLEQDTLLTEAAAIRDIVEKYSKNQDQQYRQVAALPYYNTIIKSHLPKLRSMKCEYTAEIYRALTKEEIMNRYQNDPDYRSGKKNFALYEYWHLFNMIKDPKELEQLYRHAYDYSKELTNGKPWILAANNLGVSYLKRDTVDLEILKPLIDIKVKRCNVERKFDGRVIGIDNVEEVVANQLAMYLKKGSFSEASILARILPNTEKNKVIKAFTLCLGGYYKVKPGLTAEEAKERAETFKLVSSSSPLNKVIMALAMKDKDWDAVAEAALGELPADDPKTLYLKAVINCRKAVTDPNPFALWSMYAEEALSECFKKDPNKEDPEKSFIKIAEWDGDISKDCFKYAKEKYETEMSLEENDVK